MWTLEQGLTVVRALQEHIRTYGYHLTLGGGVINKGSSNKDLDLYFLPMGCPDRSPERPGDLLAFLEMLWGKSEDIRVTSGGEYGDEDSFDPNGLYQHAVKFNRQSKTGTKQRIDVFIY